MKIKSMLREVGHLIREHKLYFMAPILISLILFAILFFKVGPGIIITFIYAGV
ncbi:MAG TPA: DUF5989 family protein [Pseudobdellovibrionaceae bacterium]|jgi:hypothetical protein|nr:DUF5989 family protein [Pseudobdellovibrionaceae bacterium]